MTMIPLGPFEDDDEDEDDSPWPYPSLVKKGVLWFCGLNFAKRNAKFGCLGVKMTRFCREIRRFC